jgi:hypothetical protein
MCTRAVAVSYTSSRFASTLSDSRRRHSGPVHLNYGETVLPMKDGLPKLNDFPAAVGGSGEAIPE